MKKIKSKLSFFAKLMLFFNGIVVLAMLLAYLAPIIDPRTFWPIAFFGLAYPPLLLLNVLFIVYWLFARHSRFALVSICTILVGYNVLLDNVGFSLAGKEGVDTAASLRVMTYNVHSFKPYNEKKDTATRLQILRLIDSVHPDVIGMPEFFSRKKGRFAMKDSLVKLFKASEYYIEAIQENEQEFIGLAIFSRFPIVSKGSVPISEPGDGNQCIYTDIKKGSQIIRYYSAHLQSIRFEAQDYQYLDTVAKSGKADISSTKRLASKLKSAFLKRAEQVFKIKDHAAQCPYPYVISGDFNDTPTSFAVSQMQKGLKNTFREKGFGLGRTYNGDFPNYQIDYIMATPQFKVLSYSIVQQKLSDHYPVYADLTLQ